MATTTFTGPIVSLNGFVGDISLTNVEAETLTVYGSTLLKTVTATTINATGVFTLTNKANLLSALNVIVIPTVDPAVAGAIWNDAGTLSISAGA